MKNKITNRDKIEALRQIYKLKAEYYKDEVVRDLTSGFSNTTTFSKVLNVADIISAIGKITKR